MLRILFVVIYTLSIFNSNIHATAKTLDTKTGQAAQTTAILEFTKAWARPSFSPTSNSAIYLNITNNSNTNFILTSASASDIANIVELHQSFVDEEGISKMVSVDQLLIPANTTVKLEPGGMHIMLIDLKTKLKVKDKFKVKLNFEGQEPKEVEVQVRTNLDF